MEAINQLLQLDIIQWIYTTFIVVAGTVGIINLVGKFCNFIGKPLKWFHSKNEDHELLVTTATALATLTEKQCNDVEQSIRHDKEIKNELMKLRNMFVDKEIEDWRWEILDFASAISRGRSYSKEQYDHVLSIYEKYEKLLEECNLSNGQVTASMEVVNEMYKEHLKNGF